MMHPSEGGSIEPRSQHGDPSRADDPLLLQGHIDGPAALDDDEEWEPKPRKKSSADFDITPMIDMTFLLLIFFMVSSTMQGAPELEVPVAKKGVGVESSNSLILTVKKPQSVGGTPQIQADGKRDVTLDGIRGEVEAAVKRGSPEVIVKADGGVSHGFVQDVVRAVVAVEGASFSFGVRDKKGE